MKTNVKRIIATTAAAAAVASIASMASAQDADNIYINGALSQDHQIKVIENKKFIPLRAICEELGFDVEWENDTRTIIISSMPVYITCSPDRDGYTFAKTAPMMLGEAPRLIDDLTYVPLNFVDEILMGTLEEKEDGIYILYGEAAQKNTVSGEICEMIYKDDKLVQIAIGDKEDIYSQTILNLSEELAEKAAELGLDVGSQIVAEITDLQTMSIPPQVIPTSLSVAEKADEITEAVEGVEVTATVYNLIYDENEKLVQLVTGDKEDITKQVVYNLTEELAKRAELLGITEGTTFVGTASPAQTRSLPPQQALLTIDSIQSVAVSGTVCELIYRDDKLVQIAVGDKDDLMTQTVFNLTEELAKAAEELDIKEGTKIRGTAKPMQTMSIPPQQPLLTIEIDN
jgi:uncharacterized protein YunC (DUF1805 family)